MWENQIGEHLGASQRRCQHLMKRRDIVLNNYFPFLRAHRCRSKASCLRWSERCSCHDCRVGWSDRLNDFTRTVLLPRSQDAQKTRGIFRVIWTIFAGVGAAEVSFFTAGSSSRESCLGLCSYHLKVPKLNCLPG